MPGDILVGDEDGVVVVPRRDAEELLEAARQNLAGEQQVLDRMRAGSYTQQEHREDFTGLFLHQGGEFISGI